MNKVFEGFLFRLLIPLMVGAVLYLQIYILHFFNYMEFSLSSVLVIMIPVILIFEIDRLVNHYFNNQKSQKTLK
ncbi:MAG: hypothetical protein AAFO07_07855, partial [Bacteroidota bacterium]